VTKDTTQIHRLISYLSGENKNFYLRMTGRQNLEFFAALYGLESSLAKTKIAELARWLKITEYLDTMAQQYSSGIMQRCHLLRGLLHDAPILFWDEPTKNLDELMAKDVRDFIKNELVLKKKKTVIMTSHRFSEIAGITDKIAILHNGRLKAFGALGDLSKNIPLMKDDFTSLYQFYLNQ
jgi:ABC-2 type transport system ATP-binding protein